MWLAQATGEGDEVRVLRILLERARHDRARGVAIAVADVRIGKHTEQPDVGR